MSCRQTPQQGCEQSRGEPAASVACVHLRGRRWQHVAVHGPDIGRLLPIAPSKALQSEREAYIFNVAAKSHSREGARTVSARLRHQILGTWGGANDVPHTRLQYRTSPRLQDYQGGGCVRVVVSGRRSPRLQLKERWQLSSSLN